MNRREFLGVAGVTGIGLSPIQRSTKSNLTVDASIFLDSSVFSRTMYNSAEFTQKLYDVLDHSVQTISSDITIDRTITSSYTLDIAGKTDSTNDLYAEFQKYLNDISEEHVSDYSNIIIVSADTTFPGRGSKPRQCVLRFGNRISIVVVNNFTNDIQTEKIPKHIGRQSSNRFIPVMIHEFGHNLGFTHEMGDYLGRNNGEIYVTPMLSGYICSPEYHGQINDFGTPIPEITCSDNEEVHISTQFNRDISKKQITKYGTHCNRVNPDMIWRLL